MKINHINLAIITLVTAASVQTWAEAGITNILNYQVNTSGLQRLAEQAAAERATEGRFQKEFEQRHKELQIQVDQLCLGMQIAVTNGSIKEDIYKTECSDEAKFLKIATDDEKAIYFKQKKAAETTAILIAYQQRQMDLKASYVARVNNYCEKMKPIMSRDKYSDECSPEEKSLRLRGGPIWSFNNRVVSEILNDTLTEMKKEFENTSTPFNSEAASKLRAQFPPKGSSLNYRWPLINSDLAGGQGSYVHSENLERNLNHLGFNEAEVAWLMYSVIQFEIKNHGLKKIK